MLSEAQPNASTVKIVIHHHVKCIKMFGDYVKLFSCRYALPQFSGDTHSKTASRDAIRRTVPTSYKAINPKLFMLTYVLSIFPRKLSLKDDIPASFTVF